jgi:aryl-alcohol dehydrogenase-like predicted oxidoreductase
MQRREIGRTGVRVCPLCLGGNSFGWTADETASFEVLDAYLEAGGNFLDTADAYSRWVPGHSGGESETIIGRWLETRGVRDRVVLATKVGAPMGDEPHQKGLSRRHLTEAVDASLARLRTDRIDVYYAHYDDPETPITETLEAFDELVRSGKVGMVAASNFSPERLRESLATSRERGWARYECLQPPYNLLNRLEYEAEREAICVTEGLDVVVYPALAGGFLTGKYRRDGADPDTRRAPSVRSRYVNEHGFRVLDAVEAVAAEAGATPAQVSLAWILGRPSVAAPIASATSGAQVGELMGALDLRLEPEAMRRLDAASVPAD